MAGLSAEQSQAILDASLKAGGALLGWLGDLIAAARAGDAEALAALQPAHDDAVKAMAEVKAAVDAARAETDAKLAAYEKSKPIPLPGVDERPAPTSGDEAIGVLK